MDNKSSKRPTVWGVHSTPAEAVEAARKASAERIALLEAEVVRLTNELNQARTTRDLLDRRLHAILVEILSALPLLDRSDLELGQLIKRIEVIALGMNAPKEAE
jgi:hypothetical protein